MKTSTQSFISGSSPAPSSTLIPSTATRLIAAQFWLLKRHTRHILSTACRRSITPDQRPTSSTGFTIQTRKASISTGTSLTVARHSCDGGIDFCVTVIARDLRTIRSSSNTTDRLLTTRCRRRRKAGPRQRRDRGPFRRMSRPSSTSAKT